MNSAPLPRRPGAAFLDACTAAGLSPPTDESERRKFAARALQGAKTKAELWAKVARIRTPHSEALDLVGALLGFSTGWHGCVSFAKQYPHLSPFTSNYERHSLGLAMASWVLTDETVARFPVAEGFTRYLRARLTEMLEDEESAEFVLRRVFFKSDYNPKQWTGYSPADLGIIFTDMLAWEPSRFVVQMLARLPVVDGKASTWPALASITCGRLVDMPLANRDEEVGFGYCGWEHAVASMQEPLLNWAAVPEGSWWLDDHHESDDKKMRAQAQSTRLSCRELLTKQMSAIANQSVLDVISNKEGSNGFISQLYGGTPIEVEDQLRRLLRSTVKRLTFEEPVEGGYLLSIFRTKYSNYDEGPGACYNADAVLHNAAKEMIAKVSLVLSVVPEESPLAAFVSHLDSTNDNDIQEMGLSVAYAVIDEGALQQGEWTRLLVVRDWEVRKVDRKRGLGLLLLKLACKKAFRGLPGPSAVAAKLWPMQLSQDCREAIDGIAEIDRPVARIKEYWKTKVLDAGVLPPSVKGSVNGNHYIYMQSRSGNMELMAIGACLHRAREFDHGRRSLRGVFA